MQGDTGTISVKCNHGATEYSEPTGRLRILRRNFGSGIFKRQISTVQQEWEVWIDRRLDRREWRELEIVDAEPEGGDGQ